MAAGRYRQAGRWQAEQAGRVAEILKRQGRVYGRVNPGRQCG